MLNSVCKQLRLEINFSSRRMSRRCLYAMAKSRWQIENQASTIPRTATDLSISAITTSAACSWSGC